jgi:F0F1-type ATP synthase assembly protein I
MKSSISDRPGDVAKTTRDAFRTVSMSSVGLEMGIAVLIGLLLGRWLDGHFGTTPWLLIVGTCLGMAAGMMGVFRAMREADRAVEEKTR